MLDDSDQYLDDTINDALEDMDMAVDEPEASELQAQQYATVADEMAAAAPLQASQQQHGGPLKSIVRGSKIGPGGRYTVTCRLNSGATATVYAAIDTTVPEGTSTHAQPAKVAIKVLEQHVPMRVVEAEVNATRVDHPGVVQPLGMFIEGGATVCVVFRLVEGKDLLDTLNAAGGRFPEARARRYAWQVCNVVRALHRAGLCHRDLKAENIVVDQATDCIALIDFGLSKAVTMSGCATLGVGTPDYMAPEILVLEPTVHGSKKYDGRAVDVWSLGVLVYVCMCGLYPFEQRTARGDLAIGATLQAISNAAYRPLPAGVASSECLAFVKDTLRIDLASRPSAEQLCRHAWFRTGGYNLDLVKQNWPPPDPTTSPASNVAVGEGSAAAGTGQRVKTKRTLVDKCRKFFGVGK